MYRFRNEYQNSGTLSASDKSLLDKIMKGGLRDIPEKDRARAKSLYADYSNATKKQNSLITPFHHTLSKLNTSKPIMTDTSRTPKQLPPVSLEDMIQPNYDPHEPTSEDLMAMDKRKAITDERNRSKWATNTFGGSSKYNISAKDAAKQGLILALQTLQVPAATVGEGIKYYNGDEDASWKNIIPGVGNQNLVGDALDIENDNLRAGVNFIADPSNFFGSGFLKLGTKTKSFNVPKITDEVIDLRKGWNRLPLSVNQIDIPIPYPVPTVKFNPFRATNAAVVDGLENWLSDEGIYDDKYNNFRNQVIDTDLNKNFLTPLLTEPEKNKYGVPTKYLPYQEGGRINTISETLPEVTVRPDNRNTQLLLNNMDKPMVKRMFSNNAPSIKLPGESQRSTHLMNWGEVGDENNPEGYAVYPSLVQDSKSKNLRYAEPGETNRVNDIYLPANRYSKDFARKFSQSGYKQAARDLKPWFGGNTFNR